MRIFYHTFIGISAMYLIGIVGGFSTMFNTFDTVVASIVCGFILTITFEGLQLWLTKKAITFKISQAEKKEIVKDVIVGTIAFVIGGILSKFYYNQILMITLLIISAIILVYDFTKPKN
jgi:hypothetical protein